MKKNILVTGGAGFIGSNIVKSLLNDENVDKVRVLDNLATGYWQNLEEFAKHPKFDFVFGDIRDKETCFKATIGMDAVCHQAALGSVPRSVADPITTNAINIDGTLNIFWAAKENGIKRVVYASSSSVYGDNPILPKKEENTGNPLSPYAVTKAVSERYSSVFGNLYGMEMIGLRYFNIFGPNQHPGGAYAAVLPLFINALREDKAPTIFGDGLTSRDFTFVENAVNANKKALFSENPLAYNQVYNIACGERTTLIEMFDLLKQAAGKEHIQPNFAPERAGDIKHSLADISKATELLGYEPTVKINEGMKITFDEFKW